MATVIQVHRFLANLTLGNPAKQQELSLAVDQLKERQRKLGGNAKLRVSKEDLLYQLYIEGLNQKPHQFERFFGDTRCVIYTNTPLEKADMVLLFLHGFGASPWHFVRVAAMLFEQNNIDRLRIAFIFPFGANKMIPGEFGAVEDSLYGSYKWWSIFNSNTKPGTSLEISSPSVEVGLLTGASLAIPTVLREARSSPRIFPPALSQGFSTQNFPTPPPPPPTLTPSPLPTPPLPTPPSLSPPYKDPPAHGGKVCSTQIPVLTPKDRKAVLKTMTYPTSQGPRAPWLTPPNPQRSLDVTTPKQVRLRWYQQCGLCMDRDATEVLIKNDDAANHHHKGETTKFTVDNPAGRASANQQIMILLAELESKYRIPVSRVGICGFSQGAMLALDVFHRLRNSPPAFLAVFSGAPMCVDQWRAELQRTAAMKRCPVLQFHGTRDWIFPIFIGRWLNRFLVREGLNVVQYSEFNGDHELTEQTVEAFNAWVLKYTRDKSVFNFSSNKRRSGGGFAHKVDDLFYRMGYGLAACLLPFAKNF